MSTSSLYSVDILEYAQSHFIKKFLRKDALWDQTYKTIEMMLSHIDNFLKTDKITRIHISGHKYIAKCEFKLIGTNQSPKTSGNRIIIYVDTELRSVEILLVYSKTDIHGSNETARRQKEIKTNYPNITKYFSGI